MKMTKTPRGAWVEYRYHDEDDTTEPHLGYISFGDYDEDAGTDTYGVHDTRVFYYSSTEELPTLMERSNGEDFYILSFSFVYTE